MSLKLDWRPRDYGAYETMKEDGSFPGPEEVGRDYFTHNGVRKAFEEKSRRALARALSIQ